MNTIGKLFSRIATTTTMVLLALVIALPWNASVLAAAAFTPDDFNRCSLNTGVWQVQNPAGFPSPRISGQYSGESVLEIPVPEAATFSSTRNAPRVMQPAADADFEVEVKFTSPLGAMSGNNYHMQGILVHDAAANKWLRFDIDSGYNSSVNAPAINAYVAYLEAAPTYRALFGPGVLGSNVNATPIYMRVRYDKANNHWYFGYRLGETGNITWRYDFSEAAEGITFNVSHIGVFAGATGNNPPGFVSKVDYIRSVPDAFTDDAITLNVTTIGSGTVNWPPTSSSQCNGNVVSLTATSTGGGFSGWSGDFVSSSPTIQLTMTQSYNVTASFTGGQPVELPFDFFMPLIGR